MNSLCLGRWWSDNVRRVSTRIQQALYDARSGLLVLDAQCEVERGRLFKAVDRVDVALIVREDVLQYGKVSVGCPAESMTESEGRASVSAREGDPMVDNVVHTYA